MTRTRLEILSPPSFDNPFSTRRVRPGAIPFRFPKGDSAEQLLDRLRANRWRGAIVGPHGSGKSTLLATLEPLLVNHGRELQKVTLRDRQRTPPKGFAHYGSLHANTLVIVDGFEQLNYFASIFLGWKCYRHGAGLLVTAHKPVRLPELFRTAPSLELAEQLTRELLATCDERMAITPSEIAAAFAQHPDNLRETFFSLYDLFESRKSSLH